MTSIKNYHKILNINSCFFNIFISSKGIEYSMDKNFINHLSSLDYFKIPVTCLLFEIER